MHHNLQELVRQWTRISHTATELGQEYADLDALSWFNFLAFDMIGDLVSFWMLRLESPEMMFLLASSSLLNQGIGFRGAIWNVGPSRRYRGSA